MTIELFKAVTPYVTLLLCVVVGLFGWFLKLIVNETRNSFDDLKKEIADLRTEMKAIDKEHQSDARDMLDKFVTQQLFWKAIGEQKGVVDHIFARIDDLSRTLNQTIGELRGEKKNG